MSSRCKYEPYGSLEPETVTNVPTRRVSRLTEFTHVWKEWQVEIKDILVDERARKSVGHMVTHMTTKGGQRYDFEFIFKLLLTEDGTQIEKVEEFVDTALAAQVMAEQKALAEALQSKA